MPAPAYKPSPEALRMISQWQSSRAAGRRVRPYAKEIYLRLGIGHSTFYKLVKEAQRP